jgi:hypothetical protein
VAVVVASLVALTLTPVLALMLLARGAPGRAGSPLIARLPLLYERSLGAMLRSPRSLLVVAGVCAVAALAAVPLLADAPKEALVALARAAVLERYGAATEVAERGDPLRRLLLVLDGELELVRDDGAGVGPSVRFARGDFLGELALLSDERLPGVLRAVTPVRLLALTRTDFLAAADTHPELQRAVLRQLARRRAALSSATSVSGGAGMRVLSP